MVVAVLTFLLASLALATCIGALILLFALPPSSVAASTVVVFTLLAGVLTQMVSVAHRSDRPSGYL